MEITPARIAWAAVIVGAAALLFFSGRFYLTGDVQDVFLPLETFYREEMLAGRIPAWWPDAAWGFPVMASGQLGFFYPPLLLTRWLPVFIYLPLLFVGHLAFAGIGTYLFLRRLKLSQAAALIGALSFALGQFILQHTTHLNVVFTAVWLPWQLLAAHQFIYSPRRGRAAALLAGALGIPFLAGQLQIPLLIAIVSGAYLLVHMRRQQLSLALATVILAVGIACAQLLPSLELVQYSDRSEGQFDIERANQYSWPLYHLPTTLFPRFFGNDDTYWGKRLEIEYGIFIGTIPLLLALWTFSQKKNYSLPVTRYPLRFFRWLAVVSFLLSLGSLSPFRLLGIEPSLWFFSAPARWLLFTTFSLATLAAFGFDRLRENPRSFKRLATWAAAFLVGGVIVSNALLFFFDAPTAGCHAEFCTSKITSLWQSARASSISLASPYTFLPLATLAAVPWIMNQKKTRQILLMVVAGELLLIAATTSPLVAWKDALKPPLTIQVLPAAVQAGQARIYSIREGGDTGAYFTDPGSRSTPAKRAQQRELLLPLMHTRFRIAGTEWPASLPLETQTKMLQSLQAGETYAVADTSVAEQLNIGAILKPSGETNVALEVLLPAPRASLQNQPAVPVTYEEISPSHIRLTFAADQPDTLIVRDTFYRGWRATVDSQPAQIEPVDEIFRAVSVPGRSRVVDMQYHPRTLYTGLIISALALAILATLTLQPARKIAP